MGILIPILVLLATGVLCAVLLTLASVFFSVKENEKVAAVREYAQTILEKALDDIMSRMNQGTMKLEGMESTMLGKIQGGVSKVDNTPKRRSPERKATDFFKNNRHFDKKVDTKVDIRVHYTGLN